MCQSEYHSRLSTKGKAAPLNIQMTARRPSTSERERKKDTFHLETSSADEELASPLVQETGQKDHAVSSEAFLDALSLYSERLHCPPKMLFAVADNLPPVRCSKGIPRPSQICWCDSDKRRCPSSIPWPTAWSAGLCRDGNLFLADSISLGLG